MSSSSFSHVLLSCLNITIVILSLISIAPTIIINSTPTSTGWSFIIVSSMSMLASIFGFYSHSCFITHVTLVIVTLAAQSLAILALFTKEKSTLLLMKSHRDPREVMVLGRLECGILVVMFLLQMFVLCLTGCVSWCGFREYKTVVEDSMADVEMKQNDSEKMNTPLKN